MAVRLTVQWFALCRAKFEASRLHGEGDRVWAKGDRLRAQSNKFYAEGDRAWAEGRIKFLDAVIAVHGPDAPVDWTPEGCVVDGQHYKYKDPV